MHYNYAGVNNRIGKYILIIVGSKIVWAKYWVLAEGVVPVAINNAYTLFCRDGYWKRLVSELSTHQTNFQKWCSSYIYAIRDAYDRVYKILETNNYPNTRTLE